MHHLRSWAVFLMAVVVLCGGGVAAAEPVYLPPALHEVADGLRSVFDAIDASMHEAAGKLSETGIDSDEARAVLAELLAAHPYAVDACTVNPWGRIVAAEPEAYRNIEGQNIRRQEQMRRLYQTHEPVMSLVIDTVEGFPAIDIEHPVFNEDEMLIGSVSLLIRHGVYLEDVIRPHVQGEPVDIWVTQKDGTVLFGADSSRIGTNVLTDDVYRAQGPLLGVAQQVSMQPSGATTYELPRPESDARTKRSLHWTSVDLYGTTWRVAMVQVVEGEDAAAKGEFDDLQLMFARDALKRTCERSLVRRYMHGDNTVGMRRILEGFHAAHPFLYSVQWLDGAGVTRFGYPESNSLNDYDHNSLRNPRDQEFLDALRSGEEHWLVKELVEGGEGVIYMCPVKSKDTILGMIYFISLLRPEQGQEPPASP
ncbi:MAG: PDC sensor domain-containing protein [Candidatus Hydrogenedentes bacterium]|nr:PDC sensor domain-containing protein [Candidatus Hydrogenedentota bacterium]